MGINSDHKPAGLDLGADGERSLAKIRAHQQAAREAMNGTTQQVRDQITAAHTPTATAAHLLPHATFEKLIATVETYTGEAMKSGLVLETTQQQHHLCDVIMQVHDLLVNERSSSTAPADLQRQAMLAPPLSQVLAGKRNMASFIRLVTEQLRTEAAAQQPDNTELIGKIADGGLAIIYLLRSLPEEVRSTHHQVAQQYDKLMNEEADPYGRSSATH